MWVEKMGGTLKKPTPKDAPSAAEKTLDSINEVEKSENSNSQTQKDDGVQESS